MSEFEIISLSAIGGGFVTQIGSRLIDYFFRDKRADKGADIANVGAILDVNDKLIEQFKEIIDDLRQEICMRYSCDLRLSGNEYLNLKNVIKNGNKKDNNVESKGGKKESSKEA